MNLINEETKAKKKTNDVKNPHRSLKSPIKEILCATHLNKNLIPCLRGVEINMPQDPFSLGAFCIKQRQVRLRKKSLIWMRKGVLPTAF